MKRGARRSRGIRGDLSLIAITTALLVAASHLAAHHLALAALVVVTAIVVPMFIAIPNRRGVLR